MDGWWMVEWCGAERRNFRFLFIACYHGNWRCHSNDDLVEISSFFDHPITTIFSLQQWMPSPPQMMDKYGDCPKFHKCLVSLRTRSRHRNDAGMIDRPDEPFILPQQDQIQFDITHNDGLCCGNNDSYAQKTAALNPEKQTSTMRFPWTISMTPWTSMEQVTTEF